MDDVLKTPIKILLVDDKPENILAMETVLENENYEFRKAYSSKEALKILLKEEDFALILMDVNMPEMNGFETAKMIYKREKLSHIPIIFITAYDYSEESLFKGYLSGGVDYICKPVNSELLKIKVQVFIELFKKSRLLSVHEQKLKQINYHLEQGIKERKKVEEELRLRNMQLSEAQKLTHLGSWEWNVLTNKITGSDEIYDIYEMKRLNDFTLEKLLGKIHPADIDRVRTTLADSITGADSFDIHFRYIPSGKQIKYINKKGIIIKNERNEVVKIIGTSQDITDLKKTEEQLRIFNVLERMLNEIYIFSEKNFKVLYANEEALRNLGYDSHLINNCTLFDILKEFKKSSFRKAIAPLLNGTKDKIIMFGSFKRNNGSFYPVEVHLQLLEQNEKKVFLATVLDLTERKRTEQVLTESLKEKEILLKEVHHRVKNNLQIIYSLINLQSNSISDKGVLEIFKVSQNRIKSMALIHEKLYRQNNLSMVNFTEYLNDLVSSLSLSYNIESSEIEFKLNTEQVFLNIDLAVSLGLCVTELITNCFKYAFPDNRKGEICLDLKLIANNKMVISIKDNGIGLPEKFDFKNNDSLGLKLVSSLVEQHHELLGIDQNGSTTFILEIPIKDNIISSSQKFSANTEDQLISTGKLRFQN